MAPREPLDIVTTSYAASSSFLRPILVFLIGSVSVHILWGQIRMFFIKATFLDALLAVSSLMACGSITIPEDPPTGSMLVVKYQQAGERLHAERSASVTWADGSNWSDNGRANDIQGRWNYFMARVVYGDSNSAVVRLKRNNFISDCRASMG